jgi:sulfate adenylyltransferase subunit 2
MQEARRPNHLQRLEQSIHILREVVAESERPVMLYSIGKDSSVMLHLAMKAFWPAPPPFPAAACRYDLEIPRDVSRFREKLHGSTGFELHRSITNLDGVQARRASPLHPWVGDAHRYYEDPGLRRRSTSTASTRRSAGPAGTKRNRAPRSGSFPSATSITAGIPAISDRSRGAYYNTRKKKGESLRVFPLSNWTELDVWQYIYVEKIPVVPLYFAKPRPVVDRDGTLIMVDDERMPLNPGEAPEMRSSASGRSAAIRSPARSRSTADTLPQVHSGDAGRGTPSGKAASSIATATDRWKRRNRKVTSDARFGRGASGLFRFAGAQRTCCAS